MQRIYRCNRLAPLWAVFIVGTGFTARASTIHKDGFDVSCAADSDADRLLDCDEFLHGTLRLDGDTDSDGIGDGDEILGTTEGLDLPALGADPLHKQIFLEIDWTDDHAGCPTHTHLPAPFATQGVIAMFANAPVTNPDGTDGIELVIDVGQGGLFDGGNFIALADGLVPAGPGFEPFQLVKQANHDAVRVGYFHYAIFAHAHTEPLNTSSGVADPKGDDLVVTLGCLVRPQSTPFNDVLVRNTLAHELGHNLGLRHGGDSGCNHRPNYNSIMNYRYQFLGRDLSCTAKSQPALAFDVSALDYSRGERRPLDENVLDETVGVCAHLELPGVAIDWNKDGSIDKDVSADINPLLNASDQLSQCGGMKSVLTDFDDWSHVVLDTINPSNAGEIIPGESECQSYLQEQD